MVDLKVKRRLEKTRVRWNRKTEPKNRVKTQNQDNTKSGFGKRKICIQEKFGNIPIPSCSRLKKCLIKKSTGRALWDGLVRSCPERSWELCRNISGPNIFGQKNFGTWSKFSVSQISPAIDHWCTYINKFKKLKWKLWKLFVVWPDFDL